MHENKNISQKDIIKIVSFAALVDLIELPLEFIPIVGWGLIVAIDAVAYLIFYMWFKRLGVDFRNFKRFLFFNSGFILDLIPIINTFAWTIDVSMVLWSIKKEEITSKIVS
jgi:hypothetical protein